MGTTKARHINDDSNLHTFTFLDTKSDREIFEEDGFKYLYALGDEDSFHCDVYQKGTSDNGRWLFDYWTYNGRYSLLFTEDQAEAVEYIHKASVQCIKVNKAINLP